MTERTILQKSKTWKFSKDKVYEQFTFMKPFGLWYSLGDAALSFQTLTGKDIEFGDYKFSIKINLENFIILENYEDVLKFSLEYSVKKNDLVQIDWKLVTENYDGIEIRNYKSIIRNLREIYSLSYLWKYHWFTTFDFDSGCIWNLNCVEKVSYIGKV